jgi:hypothetical protein
MLYMGRDYPQGYDYYRTRLHKAFWSQRQLEDEEAITKGIQRAEFVKKGKLVEDHSIRRQLTIKTEIEALYELGEEVVI